MSVTIYQSTQCCIPGDIKFLRHCFENLRFWIAAHTPVLLEYYFKHVVPIHKSFIAITGSQVLIVKSLSSFLGMDTAGIHILIDCFLNIDEFCWIPRPAFQCIVLWEILMTVLPSSVVWSRETPRMLMNIFGMCFR